MHFPACNGPGSYLVLVTRPGWLIGTILEVFYKSTVYVTKMIKISDGCMVVAYGLLQGYCSVALRTFLLPKAAERFPYNYVLVSRMDS